MHLIRKANDPAFWEQVRTDDCFSTFRNELRDLYTRLAARDVIPDMEYSKYKLYWTTGNRSAYERDQFDRRLATESAALLSLIYPENTEYFEKLQDLLFCTCNEYSWCLPAHQGAADRPDSTIIDLFSAEMGFTLAEIYVMLENRLDALIRNRILVEIDRRIFRPFLENDPYPYTGWENRNHNWAAVCMGSVACTFMLLRPDDARANIPRFERTMETYLSGFRDDGICSEGIGYWHYGFGFFTVYADMLRLFTDGEIDHFKRPKVRTVAAFLQKMFLSGMATASFADGSRAARYQEGLLHYLKQEYPEDILVYAPEYSYRYDGCGRFCLHLRSALWLDTEIYRNHAPLNTPLTYYAPDLQWFICKRPTYGLAAKAGSNAELHNHNDVGSFIFAKDGVQCLTDLGAGAYTRQYFDGRLRYTILECASRSHSVPLVGGVEQYVGAEAHAKDVIRQDNLFSFDMAAAYHAPGLNTLQRTFRCEQDHVVLTDSFDYSGDGCVIDRLTSLIEPQRIDDCTLRVGTATVTYDPSLCSYALTSEPTNTGAPCYMMDFTPREGVTSLTFVLR